MADDHTTDDAIDRLSIAPDDPAETADTKPATDPRQEAGQDVSIARRLERNPDNEQAKLDAGLDESMDASDPPSVTQPGSSNEPAPSSGYDEEAEAKR